MSLEVQEANPQIDSHEAATDSYARNVSFYYPPRPRLLAKEQTFSGFFCHPSLTWKQGETATFLRPSWTGLPASSACPDTRMCEPDKSTVSIVQLSKKYFLVLSNQKVTSCSLLDWNIRRHSPHLHVVLRRPWREKTNQSQLKSSRCNLGGTRHPRGARLLELLLPPVVGAAAKLVNQPLVRNNLKNFVLVVIPERREIIIVSLIKQFYYQCTCVLQSRREFTSMNLK